MATSNLKQEIYDKLESADDSLLKEVLALIDFETDEDVYITNIEERNSIEQAIEQVRNGEFHSNEEVERESEIWLNE